METFSVTGKNGEQLLFGNSSLLQVEAMSVLGGMRAPQLTTARVRVLQVHTPRGGQYYSIEEV